MTVGHATRAGTAVVDEAYHLGHQPLPGPDRGPRRAERGRWTPRDVVVQAAGLHARRPADAVARPGPQAVPRRVRLLVHGLRDRRRRSAIKMAAPDREVFVLVGDGSYLMMAQEIVTAVSEGIKLNLVLVQNHGFASIGALSESLGSQRFGTRYRYRDPATGTAGRRRAAGRPGGERGSLGRRRAPRTRRSRSSEPRSRTARASDADHRRPHRDRPARPRALLGELVGRAGVARSPRSTAPSRRARPTRPTSATSEVP